MDIKADLRYRLFSPILSKEDITIVESVSENLLASVGSPNPFLDT